MSQFRQCVQAHTDWVNYLLLCNYDQTGEFVLDWPVALLIKSSRVRLLGRHRQGLVATRDRTLRARHCRYARRLRPLSQPLVRSPSQPANFSPPTDRLLTAATNTGSHLAPSIAPSSCGTCLAMASNHFPLCARPSHLAPRAPCIRSQSTPMGR